MQLSMTESLSAGLAGHTVVEFPTLVICRSDQLSLFRLLISGAATSQEESVINSSLPSEAVADIGDFVLDDSNGQLEVTIPEDEHDGELLRQVSVVGKANAPEVATDEMSVVDEADEEDVGDDDSQCVAEDEDDAEYNDFMSDLMDLQGKDIKALQAIINEEENQ